MTFLPQRQGTYLLTYSSFILLFLSFNLCMYFWIFDFPCYLGNTHLIYLF